MIPASPDPVFENDDLVVFHAPRDPARLVVSFAHLDFPYGEGRYWGKVVLGRTDLSALGIVSKRNDWFPESALAPALPVIRAIAARYPRRLAYGFSMGAYAAVKHSRRLDATHVLALSPQWSIDPAETPFDYRLVRFFEPARMAGMAIGPADVAGRLTLLHDPYVAPDVAHAARILRLYRDPVSIAVPRIGHETIDMMAASEVLAQVVDALLADDFGRLRAIVSRRRRSNGRRLINLILALRQRHPAWAEAVLARHRETLRPDLAHLLG